MDKELSSDIGAALLVICWFLLAGWMIYTNNRIKRLEQIVEEYYEVDVKDTTDAKN